jgi:leucyl/phenylalanyl-tRNA--protein transferase
LKTLHILDHRIWFPPLDEADDEGLLAAGGDLSTERLIKAYRSGIFPWYEGDIPLWWSPDPRFVLFPEDCHVSKSMKQVFRRNQFQFTRNKAFAEVIRSCSKIGRPGQAGTWITPAIIDSFETLFKMGLAQSFEAWYEGQLVGGLYGIKMGNVFFGESMFSSVANASKAAFIWSVNQLKQEGVMLIDCQVYTEHLESLGAHFIKRDEFIALLDANFSAQP